MVCTNARVLAPKGELGKEDFKNMGWHQYAEECDIPAEDVISKGGWLIHTASIVYRSRLRDKYPNACKKTTTGDYTLQMFAALNGKIHFFPEQMVVYRFQAANSWTAREKRQSYEGRAHALMREIDMLLSLNEYSSGHYSNTFHHRVTSSVWVHLWPSYSKEHATTHIIRTRSSRPFCCRFIPLPITKGQSS